MFFFVRCLSFKYQLPLTYFQIRYYTILLLICDVLQIHSFTIKGVPNKELCVIVDPLTRLAGAISLWAVEIIMQLRIYALYDCSKKVRFARCPCLKPKYRYPLLGRVVQRDLLHLFRCPLSGLHGLQRDKTRSHDPTRHDLPASRLSRYQRRSPMDSLDSRYVQLSPTNRHLSIQI